MYLFQEKTILKPFKNCILYQVEDLVPAKISTLYIYFKQSNESCRDLHMLVIRHSDCCPIAINQRDTSIQGSNRSFHIHFCWLFFTLYIYISKHLSLSLLSKTLSVSLSFFSSFSVSYLEHHVSISIFFRYNARLSKYDKPNGVLHIFYRRVSV